MTPTTSHTQRQSHAAFERLPMPSIAKVTSALFAVAVLLTACIVVEEEDPPTARMNGSGGTSAVTVSGSGATGPNTSSSDNPPLQGFSVVVTKYQEAAGIPNQKPKTGNRFTVLRVTLTNHSVTKPLPMAFVHFSLKTADKLVYIPSPLSGMLPMPCQPDVAVAAGGSSKCDLLFEVPANAVASELLYNDGQGHIADAPVPTSSGGIADSPACGECAQCLPSQAPDTSLKNPGCAPAKAADTLCKFNKDLSGESSFDTYKAYLGCLCGGDGVSGACGAKCSFTCTGVGKLQPECQGCMVWGGCDAEYHACVHDKWGL